VVQLAVFGYRDTAVENGGDTMSLRDKGNNVVESTGGAIKEATGMATKDRSLEAKGKAERTKGNLKQAGEKVKDAL
jgi:uncharacterized protein YjbJ (UPF0337 family)